jgi:hypothetical protein
MNSWRSQDIYSDHMVRQFEFNGLPLRRIDNCGFMIGTTGTCYYRGLHAWKGMLILELARGGWVNVYHGNLELLSDEDARWFARAQGMFLQLQQFGACTTFGEIPGQGLPYGFRAEAINGALLTIVNPFQAIVSVELPVNGYSRSAVIYSDGGFKPILTDKTLRLGPEQLAVIGFEEYAADKYNLGVDETIRIPMAIEKMETDFKAAQKNSIEALVTPLPGKHLRIILQQFGADGLPRRSWGGAPPDGQKMDSLLRIIAEQGKRQLPLKIEYDKMIWSGLSWAAAEISRIISMPGNR